MSEDKNMMSEISRELDRLGAPKLQPHGYGYSPIGRLRALTAELVGKYYGATISTLQADNKVLREALVWTDKAPTVPGWYWYQKDVVMNVCVVSQSHIDGGYFLKGTQWAGPIQEPQALKDTEDKNENH